MEKSFHMELQFIATMGQDFAVVQFETVLGNWVGEANRKISSLFHVPVNETELANFESSGRKYALLGLGEGKYLQHDTGCVFLHNTNKSNSQFGGRSSVLATTGRILIDVVRGSALGHHASNG